MYNSWCSIEATLTFLIKSYIVMPCDFRKALHGETTCTVPGNVSVYIFILLMLILPSWRLMTLCFNLLLQLTVVAPADEYSTCMHSGMAIYTVMLHKHSTSRCTLSTPGVLDWMWPCGIVVMLTELFTAESKLQVYAAFHELLSNYTTIVNNLSMSWYWNAYEYVCHLFLKPELVH